MDAGCAVDVVGIVVDVGCGGRGVPVGAVALDAGSELAVDAALVVGAVLDMIAVEVGTAAVVVLARAVVAA